MEAYFKNDPLIREWIDQTTEKIFSVCLLTGEDADAEFQNGCQIIMRIAALLQEIPTIPSEFLLGGVKQLLEQQLPDTRVLNNFPTFQANMERMLQAGVLMAIEAQNKDPEIKKELIDTPIETKLERSDDIIELFEEDEDNEDNEEFEPEIVISALAAINSPGENIQVVNYELIVNSQQNKQAGIDTKEQMTEQEQQLKNVLKNIFPNSTVDWNKNVMGQTFLAQVEDLLIYVNDQMQSTNLRKYYKEGWKVFICSPEDLAYPRRLERGIKQSQRSGKKSSLH